MMNVTVDDLTPDQLAVVKDVAVQGVHNAMMPIFMIIMVMAVIAAVISALFLKPKTKA